MTTLTREGLIPAHVSDEDLPGVLERILDGYGGGYGGGDGFPHGYGGGGGGGYGGYGYGYGGYGDGGYGGYGGGFGYGGGYDGYGGDGGYGFPLEDIVCPGPDTEIGRAIEVAVGKGWFDTAWEMLG